MKIFRLFYISVTLLALLALVLWFLDPSGITEEADTSPTSIIQRVDTDDYALRSRATEISTGCTDKECTAYRLFAQVRDHESLPHTDKAVLFASYMENMAIPVQMVFPEGTSPYVLACGLDRARLYQYILEDSLNTTSLTDTARLAAGQIWTKLFSNSEEQRLAIRIKATQPVDLTIADHDACKAQGHYILQACKINAYDLVSIFAPSETQIDISWAYIDALED
ncbi:MAG: hypothetical protein LBV04_02680, partial [Deferribacteraceae bacterium]|nr:hypothetical protein [Deferribacteraceae bacterium]